MFELGDEKDRLKRLMSQEAIALAMQGRWKEAIAVNQSIVETIPTDIDAYNRLGKAYTELGEIDKAREAYSKALELSPKNPIATKNLNRLSQLQEAKIKVKVEERPKAAPHVFIGDVGKAGVVNLYRLASNDVLAKMTAGDQVHLKVKGPQLIVENEQGEYLGQVDPQHGFRLAKLIEGGNRYTAAIVSLYDNKVKMIIRETYQHPSQGRKLSFPAKVLEGFQPHVKDALLRRVGEEEYFNEGEDMEETDLEEGEILPSGFSIFEDNTSAEEMVEEELTEEE